MFRFTIRDVLLVMVIVGLAVGWWIEHRRIRSLEFEALRWELRASSLADYVEQKEGTKVEFYRDRMTLADRGNAH